MSKVLDKAEELLFLKQINAYGNTLIELGETLLAIEDIENLDETLIEADLIRIHEGLHKVLKIEH